MPRELLSFVVTKSLADLRESREEAVDATGVGSVSWGFVWGPGHDDLGEVGPASRMFSPAAMTRAQVLVQCTWNWQLQETRVGQDRKMETYM